MSENVFGQEEKLFAGRYRLGRQLGQGGMGTVYEAIDTRLEKTVAIKTLHVDFNAHKDVISRFMHEAKATAAIAHENIVDVTDYGCDDASGLNFICYEMLKGRELLKLIESGELDLVTTLRIFVQLCSALKAAHEKGIVHRDLKPENIFILDRESGLHVKVLDFGIAKFLGEAAVDKNRRLTVTGAFLGTPSYMSWENLMAQPIDERTDVHALGVILHEMVAGVLPFEGESTAAIAHEIHEGRRKPLMDVDLNKIVAEATTWNRDERTPNVVTFAEQLKEYARKRSLLPEAPRASIVPQPEASLYEEETPKPPRASETHMGPVITNTGERERRPHRLPLRGVAAIGAMALLTVGFVFALGGHKTPTRVATAAPTTQVAEVRPTPIAPPPVVEPVVPVPSPLTITESVAPATERHIADNHRHSGRHPRNADPTPPQAPIPVGGCHRDPQTGQNVCD